MVPVGFEPTKLTHCILSATPLTARERYLFFLLISIDLDKLKVCVLFYIAVSSLKASPRNRTWIQRLEVFDAILYTNKAFVIFKWYRWDSNPRSLRMAS